MNETDGIRNTTNNKPKNNTNNTTNDRQDHNK